MPQRREQASQRMVAQHFFRAQRAQRPTTGPAHQTAAGNAAIPAYRGHTSASLQSRARAARLCPAPLAPVLRASAGVARLQSAGRALASRDVESGFPATTARFRSARRSNLGKGRARSQARRAHRLTAFGRIAMRDGGVSALPLNACEQLIGQPRFTNASLADQDRHLRMSCPAMRQAACNCAHSRSRPTNGKGRTQRHSRRPIRHSGNVHIIHAWPRPARRPTRAAKSKHTHVISAQRGRSIIIKGMQIDQAPMHLPRATGSICSRRWAYLMAAAIIACVGR